MSLDFDNLEGARLATQHLIDLGHRRIAFIAGDRDHPDADDACGATARRSKRPACAFDPALVVPGEYQRAQRLLAVDRLLHGRARFRRSSPPTTRWLSARHWAAPARPARARGCVAGRLRRPAHGSYAVPPLTTVHQPAYEMGRWRRRHDAAAGRRRARHRGAGAPPAWAASRPATWPAATCRGPGRPRDYPGLTASQGAACSLKALSNRCRQDAPRA